MFNEKNLLNIDLLSFTFEPLSLHIVWSEHHPKSDKIMPKKVNKFHWRALTCDWLSWSGGVTDSQRNVCQNKLRSAQDCHLVVGLYIVRCKTKVVLGLFLLMGLCVCLGGQQRLGSERKHHLVGRGHGDWRPSAVRPAGELLCISGSQGQPLLHPQLQIRAVSSL